MSRHATLRIFEDELRVIVSEIRRFPDRETGGALYGLWSHAGQPTVWLATRPGPHAVRRATYFADDIDTHMAVERALWDHFGIQCIGVWHSHHKLGLEVLSDGDIERTRTYARHTGRERFAEILGYYQGEQVGLKPWVYPKAADGRFVASRIQVLAGASPLRAQLGRAGIVGQGECLLPGSPSLIPDWVLQECEPSWTRPADDDGRPAAPDKTALVVGAVEALLPDPIDPEWLTDLDLFTPEDGYVILEAGPEAGSARLRVLFGWEGALQVLRWEVFTPSSADGGKAADVVASAEPAVARRKDVAGLLAGGLRRLRQITNRSDDGVGSAPAVPPGDGAKDPS